MPKPTPMIKTKPNIIDMAMPATTPLSFIVPISCLCLDSLYGRNTNAYCGEEQ